MYLNKIIFTLCFTIVALSIFSGCGYKEGGNSDKPDLKTEPVKSKSIQGRYSHERLEMNGIDSIRIESMILGGVFSIIHIKPEAVIIQDYFDHDSRTAVSIEYGQELYKYIDTLFIRKTVPLVSEKIKREKEIISDFGFIDVKVYINEQTKDFRFDMKEEANYIFRYTPQFCRLETLIEDVWNLHNRNLEAKNDQ